MNFSFFPAAHATVLGAAFVGLTATVSSATPVHSGVLECNVEPGIGFIIGSSKNLSCVFHSMRGGPEYYEGTINRIGLDIGVTGPTQFAWDVFTAGSPSHRYALVGDYRGPGAGFALGPGLTANALVGGDGDSISLQPLSGTSTGINLSVGVDSITLQQSGSHPSGA
ncbi:MAG: DUF992 domain-containing protein [Pseudomonadota bacterium]|nr:DUF992 domain-containing protein [Pseudomonadota bacterium]